jgi:beta-phosphoglucomutase-like phosphatase (HAD superfamily)
MNIPGITADPVTISQNFIPLTTGGNGLFHVGKDGVIAIRTPLDRVAELIVYEDKTLVFINSKMGHPAIYPLHPAEFEAPAEAVLMDLDGTSVRSEPFWIRVIEQTTARLLGNPRFQLEAADEPHVSGHSVSEHLGHCINKYCPGKTVEEARARYFDIVRREMAEITAGRGRPDAFQPAPGLAEFLRKLKEHRVKIGLVTSGLHEKAWPEILSAFRTLKLGDPLQFYDAIISAGHAIRPGQAGTLGELEPKPHPWLYAETARIGLGLDPARRRRIIGIEDSGAGVISIRLAGYAALGLDGGNLTRGGAVPFLHRRINTLTEALPRILG